MTERFLKFIPSEEALWLLKKRGHAFRLLTIIAESARRYDGHPDGLKIGEAFIGGHEKYDMTERNYRTAKEVLVQRRHIEIVETSRTRKKTTNGMTTAGTKVKILSTTVWDLNLSMPDERSDECPTNDRRMTDDKLRMNKKDKKDHHPYPSSLNGHDFRDDELTDDFSLISQKIEIFPGVLLSEAELKACIKLEGNIEKVRDAIQSIQDNPNRKYPIANWPNAIAKWKIKPKIRIQDNISYAENLCKHFENFNGVSWRCRMYHDRKKDQKGVIFECENTYQESIFIAFADGEMKNKCEDLIRNKKMLKDEKIL